EVAHRGALPHDDDAVAEAAGAALPYEPLPDREATAEKQHQPDWERQRDEPTGQLELDDVRPDSDGTEDQERGTSDAAVLLAAHTEQPWLVAALRRDGQQPADAEQNRQQDAVEAAHTARDGRPADPEPTQVADGHGDRDGEGVDERQTDDE